MRFLKILAILVLFCVLLAGCATPETSVSGTQTQAPAENEQAKLPNEKPVEQPDAVKPEPVKPESVTPIEKPNEETEDLKSPVEVVVPILMFHDIKKEAGGTWSMSAENFEKTLSFLLDQGYTPIFFDALADYAAGIGALPEKPVCITLDDGYYSNYKYVLPIVSKLRVPVTVFMVCGMVREEGTEPDMNERALSKLSVHELSLMENSPYVKIQSHTYALHGKNTAYGEVERSGVLPLTSEDRETYRRIFSKDCSLAEAVLNKAGVSEQIVFSYPNGKNHAWSEAVLRERGYRVTLTTDYAHVNTVKKGDPESAFLLGRMNVNDATTPEELLHYLERKGL